MNFLNRRKDLQPCRLNYTPPENPEPSVESLKYGQQILNDYNNWTEMAEHVRQTQTGRVGILAAISTLILFIFVMRNSDDTWEQFAAIVTFVLVEVFYLSTLRFNI